MQFNFRIKRVIYGMLLALPLYSYADQNNADVIAGYTTQDLAAALPTSADGLKRRSISVDPASHAVEAEYVESATKRKALVTLYALPMDSSGKIPEAKSEGEPYLKAVLASAEKEMIRQRIRPEKRELVTDSGLTFNCLETMINNKVLHLLCATTVKGRVMEVQPVTVVDDQTFDAVSKKSDDLLAALAKSVVDFKK
ncbi:hypothetical protein PCO85_11200 [Prodigiosinella aquatilis]|nr:hypothetical protein [Prodigiosinella sp. LS101]WJV55899.1 hypothetical protein PCO85_11200 [Prodigiosinella sp. LS101]WJV60260.1 hypothetical protein PCO84_11200 [Pectobacteriaceae bacterium C111]